MLSEVSISLEKVTGKSRKTGNAYTAYKLCLGDYETLLFPKSSMERNYLERLVGGQ